VRASPFAGCVSRAVLLIAWSFLVSAARHARWCRSSEDYSEDEGEEEGEEEGEDDDDSEERGVTVTVNDADDGSGADDGDDARAAALALSQPPIRHPVLPPVAARPARLVERQKLSAPVVAVPSAAAVAGFVPADGAVEPPGVSPPASASAAAATAVGLALGWREDAVRSSGRRTASHGPSGGASAGGGAATRADAATSRGQGPSHRVAGAGGHSNDPRATAAAVSLSAAVGRQVYGAADSILSAVPPDVTSLADSDAVLPPLAKRARSATAQASGEFQSAAAGAAVGPHQAAYVCWACLCATVPCTSACVCLWVVAGAGVTSVSSLDRCGCGVGRGDVPVPLTQAADKPAVSNRKKKSIEPPKRITLEHLARASVDGA
jgi:hypothetical protein